MLIEFKKQADLKCLLITGIILIVFLLSGWRGQPVHAAEGTSVISQEYAYQRMIAQKENYPEGMTWNDDNSYRLSVKLDGHGATGTGCAGFAFLMSDAAFGEGQYPARTYYTFDNIKVGDILRVNNDSHSVVVLQISASTVTVAEGNYNGKIHWGRTISLAKIQNGYANYGITRYPVEYSSDTAGYCGGVWDDTYQGTNLTWKLSDDGVLTIAGTGKMADYSGWSGGETPWYGHMDKIKKVVIENGVTSIGNLAFDGCKSLTEVSIPDTVASIGNNAFYGCKCLAEIVLPDSITEIGDSAFMYCESLRGIVFPDSITEIGANALMACSSLADVKLPNGITTIPHGMFADCKSLSEITIPDSVTTIEYAFSGCSSLYAIYVPGSVTNFPDRSIAGLVTIFCEDNSPLYAYMSTSSAKAYCCPRSEWTGSCGENMNYSFDVDTRTLTLSGNGEGAKNDIFRGFRGVKQIKLENFTGTKLPVSFTNWDSLESFEIPDGVTELESYAFSSCDNLQYVTIPSSVTKIHPFAFNVHSEDFVIKGYSGSEAESFAASKGITFKKLDGSDSGNSENGEWVTIDGKEYWYENGVRQGYNPDDASYRGKEIYDPGTDAWYWLDNVQQGAKAVSKDVYQESEAGPWAGHADGTGKWVRYDENGHMVKGWQTTSEGRYYFDLIYGTMAKGYATIEGIEYYFDPVTGVLQQNLGIVPQNGWKNIDGKEYWYEDYQRQGYSVDAAYRGKEIHDPGSGAWYWLDNVQGGAKAVSKDVYQESAAGDWAGNADGTGKWVRYDENGHMIKGWQYTDAGTYYFDLTYGTMAKGTVTIDGAVYTFDMNTGILK